MHESAVQGSVSAHDRTAPDVHDPPAHWSPVVQYAPSSHDVPSESGDATQPPAASLHTPALHGSVSEEQSGAAPPPHTPAKHASPTLQARPSPQPVPSATGTAKQAPAPSSHVPTLHGSPNVEQSVGTPPPQTPEAHASPALQNSPSSHDVPSATGTATHAPPGSSHVPVLQPSVRPEQSRSAAPPHMPPAHVSPTVQ